MSVDIRHGDCREVLKAIPDNHFDSVVTDPPYALVSIVKRFGGANAAPAKGNEAYMRASAGFMGKTWDNGETAFSHEFWAEVLRVLKPGGHVAAFGASRGYHRMACAIEDAGFEIRDSLMWCYGTGFPKSHDVSKGIDKAAGAVREIIGRSPAARENAKNHRVVARGEFSGNANLSTPATDAARQWEGWGTALKPAFEPIVLGRKPLSEGTVAANVLKWGTGALNIGACRVAGSEDTARPQGKDIRGGNWSGDGGRSDLTTGGGTGRWPANILTDGSDEVVGAFPDSKGQQGDLTGQSKGRKSKGIYGDLPAAREALARKDSGSAARFFFNSTESDSQGLARNLPNLEVGAKDSASRFHYSAKASKADRAGSKHPTVKPISLMRWLCRLITPPGGTVLDPFAGSGTTGAACEKEGFSVVLVERENEYVADIRRRFGVEEVRPSFEDMLA